MSDERGGSGRFRPIHELLPEMLASRGLDEEVARAWVLEGWGRLVGAQIAGVTQPRMVTPDGTLVVGVKTHGWMNELSLMERQLLAKLNAEVGRTPVRRIRLELMR